MVVGPLDWFSSERVRVSAVSQLQPQPLSHVAHHSCTMFAGRVAAFAFIVHLVCDQQSRAIVPPTHSEVQEWLSRSFVLPSWTLHLGRPSPIAAWHMA